MNPILFSEFYGFVKNDHNALPINAFWFHLFVFLNCLLAFIIVFLCLMLTFLLVSILFGFVILHSRCSSSGSSCKCGSDGSISSSVRMFPFGLMMFLFKNSLKVPT